MRPDLSASWRPRSTDHLAILSEVAVLSVCQRAAIG